MNQKQWQIQKYVMESGVCPFDQWFNKFDIQTQVRIDTRLDRVSAGNFGDHKMVGAGIYELRFNFGPGYRLYYGLVSNQVVLLLCGGSKKTQNKDIKNAQSFWKAYRNEQNKE